MKYVLNETSYFGANSRENLVPEIKNRGFNKVLLVSDKALCDAGVTAKATMISLILGIGGILVLGFGMSLALSDLGGVLGMPHMVAFVAGIIIGLCGMVPVVLAYPVYNRVIKKERERIAPQILRLSDELLK